MWVGVFVFVCRLYIMLSAFLLLLLCVVVLFVCLCGLLFVGVCACWFVHLRVVAWAWLVLVWLFVACVYFA